MIHYIKPIALIYLASLLLACSSSTQQAVSRDRPQRQYSQDYDKAIVAMQNGDIESARNGFYALTQKAPSYTGPWTNLGIIYANQRNYIESERHFKEALKRQAQNTVAMNWLAYISKIKKDYYSASILYQRAIEVDPEYSEAHLNLAILYEENLSRPKDALIHYKLYQSLTGETNNLVSAWIHNLEESINNYVASNGEVD
ncbi:Uncharacterised protein [Zhongshania aliphaticivorans]|uniref:Photosystem I assembly protein Ycf3 n=1 Tax=Zhongshania aliphaticivorans TaxID=1470434 RepID=A0A5S9Q644_9GAMM|nr:tetratricopeptide repeat protein [Zhongshania aliphaticivorans]CAA0094804.1 Uncharacterised protein [Zhongshania aliphaticivorans]CAA0112697.1 Uncharacterised protein [Zhongshania aliphaticivorans]